MTLRGLYVLTDAACCQPGGEARLAAALAGRPGLLQLRCKEGLSEARARALVALAHDHGVPVIINDDAHLARVAGADGVHLGRGDGDVPSARALLGPRAIIGVSCYGDLERARVLASEGADYLAFGRFFPSRTKPHAVQANPDLLRQARVFGKPLVAIGGILPDNAPALIAAGASLVAVIDGVFGQPDITAAVRAYQALFED